MKNGPGPDAFTFRKAFDPHGMPVRPDVAMVKDLAKRNAETAASTSR